MQNANQSLLEELIQNLNLLLSEMVELETSGLIGAAEVHPDHRASARNLLDTSRFAGTTYAHCRQSLRVWDSHPWVELSHTSSALCMLY